MPRQVYLAAAAQHVLSSALDKEHIATARVALLSRGASGDSTGCAAAGLRGTGDHTHGFPIAVKLQSSQLLPPSRRYAPVKSLLSLKHARAMKSLLVNCEDEVFQPVTLYSSF